jgi:hypothetical protein
VHLPLVTGTAHEDINIEYDNMLQSHAESDHGPESTSNRKKGKGVMPGEKKASPKQTRVKEEEEYCVVMETTPPIYDTELTEDGEELIIID